LVDDGISDEIEMKKLLIPIFAACTSAAMAGSLDINGDGIDDLLFQNSAGQIAVWTLNGVGGAAAAASFVFAGTLADWKLVARADLNADGIGDLILQNSSGQLVGWLMNGAGFATGAVTIYAGDGLEDWRVHAAADLNSDGIADLILQNSRGQIVGWLLNGAGQAFGAVTLYAGDLNWRVRAAGDVNGDGIADLIFQNSSGQVVAWLMNGGTGVAAAVTIYGGNPGDWALRAASDLNADGIPDLVFQNSSGQIFGWLMTASGSPAVGVSIWSGAGLSSWTAL
jgi:hypothetical protein